MIYEKLLLLCCALALAYTWAGYPLLLWVIRKVVRRKRLPSDTRPTSISLIIAVHNEERQIAAKLEDCLALEYPLERLEILVASDGSTDATEAIARQFAARDPRIRLLTTGTRAGKSGAQNLAAQHARGEILLFTDAETRTSQDLLLRIAEGFEDSCTGLIAPSVSFGSSTDSVSKGQGAYWRFELFLRQLESDIGILATVSGAAFAVRRQLFRPIPPEFGDDCVVPLDVRLQGFTVVHDARAKVCDRMPCTVAGEFRVRVRMTARNWSGILSRPSLLNPLRFPGTAWGLVSHKLLRWMTPFFLAGIFLLSGWLFQHRQLSWLFVLQNGFYLAAAAGWRRSRRQRPERIFGYPFAFCLANLGFLLGVMKGFRGQRIAAYK